MTHGDTDDPMDSAPTRASLGRVAARILAGVGLSWPWLGLAPRGSERRSPMSERERVDVIERKGHGPAFCLTPEETQEGQQ